MNIHDSCPTVCVIIHNRWGVTAPTQDIMAIATFKFWTMLSAALWPKASLYTGFLSMPAYFHQVAVAMSYSF